MLIYNPRNYKEFSQYIPQLKTSGNVQHTFLNEFISDDSATNEGTLLPVVSFSNVTISSHTESFIHAIHTCGGMSILLYLHAMVSN